MGNQEASSEKGDAKTDIGGAVKAYKMTISSACEMVDIYAKIKGGSQDEADRDVLELADWVKFKRKGRAAEFMQHFLDGSGTPLFFNLADLLKEDEGARRRVSTVISGRIAAAEASALCGPQSISNTISRMTQMTGEQANATIDLGNFEFPIRQRDFSIQDWCFALGSYTLFWEPAGTSADTRKASGPLCASSLDDDWIDKGTSALHRTPLPNPTGVCVTGPRYAHLYGAKEYHWHEEVNRVTECVHQAGYRLNKSGKARNFWMIGRPCYIEVAGGNPIACIPL